MENSVIHQRPVWVKGCDSYSGDSTGDLEG